MFDKRAHIRNNSKSRYLSLQPVARSRAIRNKIISFASALIVILSFGAVSFYFYSTLNYRFNEIVSFLNSVSISNTTDSIIQSVRSQRQLQSDVEVHYYPLGELSDMPENVRSTAVNLLLEEANDILDQEASHINEDMRDAYPDMRELEFHLRYAQEVERGIRGPELEPEWEWAANVAIVYTWVNGSEPIHLQQKSKYNGGNAKPDNRDRCVDELRYSIRSLMKNLIWHKGTIYIVAPTNHVPEWLDPTYDRIKIIDQSDLLPEKNYLGEDVNPTFNSFAIEWYLDKIEGITEQFIQINDDYFFRRPVHPSLFFYGGGEAYNLNPSLVKPLTKNEKILRERKKFNKFRKGTKVTETGIWEYLYGSKKSESEEVNKQHMYRRSLFDYNNFVPMPDPMIHYAYDEEAIKDFEEIDNQNIPGGSIVNRNNSVIVMNDIYGKHFVLDLSNGVYNGLINKEEYETKNWSPDFTINDKSNSILSMKNKNKELTLSQRMKEIFIGSKKDKSNTENYSKTYYPNAARHFHFPIIYMENRSVERDLNSYKHIGYKGTFETTWGEKFQAAEAITTFCLKSFFGEDVGINSLYHAPYVFYRDLYEPARQLYHEYLNLTLTHRFRDGFDILPPLSKLSYLRLQASNPKFEKEFDKKYNVTYIYSKENISEKNNGNKEEENKHIRTILKYGFHIMSEEYVKKLFTFGAIYDNCRHNENLFKKIMESETLLMYNLNDDYNLPEAGEQLRAFLKYMYPEPGPFEKEYIKIRNLNEN
ncbi:hypothetical protein H8356DRAFT_1622715 [Neocallimastix lanati (nom. inval.)]|jgi:hypothetical protein|nr:hypothetical protein H8356DRAFT_1622715 [Neocallimastix sp. JGI-2020a]